MTESFLNKAKSALFSIVMLLLWLPLLQSTFMFFNEEPLGGAIIEVKKPLYSYDSFLAGEFQNQLEEYQKSSFGFRNTLIRLNNQKIFSLYSIAKASSVVVGKEDFLYDKSYITSYLGEDYVGEKLITSNISQLLKVKEILNSKGKDIVFVIAPGKASYYPEYIPTKYTNKKKNKTNYEDYLAHFKKHNINYIDFSHWFLVNKSKSKYPLYPKCGIHWSKYGEYLVSDSLIKYIEKLRDIDLPKLILDSLVISKKNLFEDYDIGYGMNLLFEMPTFPMAYPYTHIEQNGGQHGIKTLVIGDSFYWGLFNREISHQIFKHGEFWYYNKSVYSYDINGYKNVVEMDLEKTINENDLFILFFSEVNMVNFDYGFINSLYQHFFNKKTPKKEQQIKQVIKQIYDNQEWLELIKKQSRETNKPIEEVLENNARFMIEKLN